MTDRKSAALFGDIFDMLAENPTEEHKAIAKRIWEMRNDYDFSDLQMCCDLSLVKLGLATETPYGDVRYND
jgi:hypothetical protein